MTARVVRHWPPLAQSIRETAPTTPSDLERRADLLGALLAELPADLRGRAVLGGWAGDLALALADVAATRATDLFGDI